MRRPRATAEAHHRLVRECVCSAVTPPCIPDSRAPAGATQNVIRKLAGSLIGVLAGVLALTVFAGIAAAQQSGGESIAGTVFNQVTQNGKSQRVPVDGVKIVVTTPDKTPVGNATSGADGKYTVTLPAAGTYVLTLDESSLPKGVVVNSAANPTSRTVNVNPNQTLIGNFFVGKDTRKTQGRSQLFLQTLVNGIKLSFIIAICSVGLSLIYGTTGLSN